MNKYCKIFIVLPSLTGAGEPFQDLRIFCKSSHLQHHASCCAVSLLGRPDRGPGLQAQAAQNQTERLTRLDPPRPAGSAGGERRVEHIVLTCVSRDCSNLQEAPKTLLRHMTDYCMCIFKHCVGVYVCMNISFPHYVHIATHTHTHKNNNKNKKKSVIELYFSVKSLLC